MNERWSLDALYTGFDSLEFQADLKKLDELCARYQELAAHYGAGAPAAEIRTTLELEEALADLTERMFLYASLRQSADTKDAESASVSGRLMNKLASITGAQTAFRQFVAKQENLDALIDADPLLTDYRYLLTNIKKDSRYLLSQREEEIMARMSLSLTSPLWWE